MTSLDKLKITPVRSLDQLSLDYLNKSTIPVLKKICKNNTIAKYSRLKKKELVDLLYQYHCQNKYSTFIQKNIRRHLVQRYFTMKSPLTSWLPSERIKMCKNDNDFYTMDSVDKIPIHQYICYIDENNCYWGFDILSLYNFFKHQKRISREHISINNPYTGIPFNESFIITFRKHLRLSKLLGFTIIVDIEDDIIPQHNAKQQLIMNVISIIEQHGYILSVQWINDLTHYKLMKFIMYLKDIWEYRARLSPVAQRQICYPFGDPFTNLPAGYIVREYNHELLLKCSLEIVMNIISKGITYADCGIGIIFVLSALTLVSNDVAEAYPWIHTEAHYV